MQSVPFSSREYKHRLGRKKPPNCRITAMPCYKPLKSPLEDHHETRCTAVDSVSSSIRNYRYRDDPPPNQSPLLLSLSLYLTKSKKDEGQKKRSSQGKDQTIKHARSPRSHASTSPSILELWHNLTSPLSYHELLHQKTGIESVCPSVCLWK